MLAKLVKGLTPGGLGWRWEGYKSLSGSEKREEERKGTVQRKLCDSHAHKSRELEVE